jgi:hypothetical protein
VKTLIRENLQASIPFFGDLVLASQDLCLFLTYHWMIPINVLGRQKSQADQFSGSLAMTKIPSITYNVQM